MLGHRSRRLIVGMVLFLFFPAAATATTEDDRALGERLVKQFYEALSPDSAALAAFMDGSFHIVGSDGLHCDRKECLSFPKSIVDFTIDDLVVRREDWDPTAIFHITYHGGFQDGARTVPSLPRLAVFAERDTGWKLVALAALGTGVNDVSIAAGKALAGFFEALSSGNAAELRAVLSPDFQIMHADGNGASIDDYLAADRPKSGSAPVVSDHVATSFSTTMVTRYRLTGAGAVVEDGATANANRMTVFQRIDGTWRVAAHMGG